MNTKLASKAPKNKDKYKAKYVFRPTLVTDFANAIPDYADLILKPDYADMTCPKPDNADIFSENQYST